MNRLLLALDPDAGMSPAALAAAWNANDRAALAGIARVETAGPGEFIPGVVELVVVPLAVNLASNAVYDLVKRVLNDLRHDSGQSPEPELPQARTSGGDLVVVIRVGWNAHDGN